MGEGVEIERGSQKNIECEALIDQIMSFVRNQMLLNEQQINSRNRYIILYCTIPATTFVLGNIRDICYYYTIHVSDSTRNVH